MRYGNLEYEMFVIGRGKVYICDEFYNYVCQLQAGESFGEASMIKETQRSFNAVAITDVTIYSFRKTQYKALLNRYPIVKEIIWNKVHNCKDGFFEEKVAARVDEINRRSAKQRKNLFKMISVRSEHIKNVLQLREEDEFEKELKEKSMHEKKRRFQDKIFGIGNRDLELPFLYFVK